MTVQASGVGMAQYTHTYNLDLEKQSIPPTIDVLGGEWVGANYILNGVFSDSDGEAVSFTLFLDGVQQGQVSVTGNQWVTDEIPFDLLIEGIHNVTIEACDSSGECTSVSEDVDNTFLFEDSTDEPHVNTPAVEEESGLPAPGIALTLLGLLGAGIALRRRD